MAICTRTSQDKKLPGLEVHAAVLDTCAHLQNLDKIVKLELTCISWGTQGQCPFLSGKAKATDRMYLYSAWSRWLACSMHFQEPLPQFQESSRWQ